MLTTNPKKRPSVYDLMEYPIVKEKFIKYGLIDFKKEKENLN